MKQKKENDIAYKNANYVCDIDKGICKEKSYSRRDIITDFSNKLDAMKSNEVPTSRLIS